MKKIFLIIIGILSIWGIEQYFVRRLAAHEPVGVSNERLRLPVQTVHKTSFTRSQNYIGSVQAIHAVSVVPYLSGFLKEVHVEAGKEVNEGEILFLLDERIPLADLKQAKEAVSEAKATRANAEAYYQRIKNTESKAISSTELEQAQTEFEAADAAYQKAIALQNQAQTLYDYTKISAPISGWVGNITATNGEYLSPEGKTLATIISFSPVRLTFAVPMAQYRNDLSFDQANLRVTLADGKQLDFSDFKVIRDNQADKSTDSVAFFIDVPNPDKTLIPGAYIEVSFLYPETGFLVNKNWISLTPDGAEIYVLNNEKIEKKFVQIGSPIGNQYWIQSGLSAEDQIITVPVSSHQIGQSAEGVSQ